MYNDKQETLDDAKLITLLDLMITEATKVPYSFCYAVPIHLYKMSVDYIIKNLKIDAYKVNIKVQMYKTFCTVKYEIKKSPVKKVKEK